MNKINSKIVIVGGGPGGLTTSMFLSKNKVHHLLIDKSVYPRDKVCGETMDGRVFYTLKRWDSNIIDEMLQLGIIHETRRFSINLKEIKIPIVFDEKNTARLVGKRIDFDNFLFQKVIASEYCQVIQGEGIHQYHHENNKIVFSGKSTQITADLGVISCGFQSGLLKNRKKEKCLYFFHRVYYKNLLHEPEKETQVYYFNKPTMCCFFINPLPNNEFNVEIGLTKSDYKKINIRLEDLMEYFIKNSPILQEKFKNAVALDHGKGVHLPIASSIKFFNDDNLLFVGACSFCVNPITGLGIGNAMVMGETAAGEIVAYLKNNDFSKSATNSYKEKALKKLKNVIRLNKVVNFFFKRTRFTVPFVMLFIKSKFLVGLLSRSDLLHYISKPFYLLFNSKGKK